MEPHIADKEGRALFHLELLGAYEPGDAVAPYVPEPEPEHWNDDHYWNDDDDRHYLGELVTCWGCGGEGNEILCCDDLCHGQGWCMHGDNAACRECGGDGYL